MKIFIDSEREQKSQLNLFMDKSSSRKDFLSKVNKYKLMKSFCNIKK